MNEAPAWLQEVVRAGQRGELNAGWRMRADDDARKSAVLMLFAPTDDGVSVILTERASTMRKHAGQVSFPGGAVEENETVIDAALREAREEVGLEAAGVEILGELAPIPLAVTNFVVHPVVAWWPHPTPLQAVSLNEVARVAPVPVHSLIEPGNRFTATRPGYAGPAFETHGLYIWGFTAFVLDAVVETAGLSETWDANDRRPLPEKFMR